MAWTNYSDRQLKSLTMCVKCWKDHRINLVSQLHVLALPLRPPYPIPTCLRDVNQWPHVLLDRACVLWGEGAVREQLRILVQSITSSRLLVSVLSYVIFLSVISDFEPFIRLCLLEIPQPLQWNWMPRRSFADLEACSGISILHWFGYSTLLDGSSSAQ